MGDVDVGARAIEAEGLGDEIVALVGPHEPDPGKIKICVTRTYGIHSIERIVYGGPGDVHDAAIVNAGSEEDIGLAWLENVG